MGGREARHAVVEAYALPPKPRRVARTNEGRGDDDAREVGDEKLDSH